MRIYDEQLARTARLQRPPASRRDDRAADPSRPNEPPSVQALDESAVLNLQRFAGNAAVAELLSSGAAGPRQNAKADEVGAPKPHLDLGPSASIGRSRRSARSPTRAPRSARASSTRSSTSGRSPETNRGLRIVAEASGVTESEEFPDGFKFSQTIETNAPLNGGVSPYTDPHPNDDIKPFYWTDAEQERYPTTFKDHPKRNPPTGTEVTYWQATLALNGVNEETQMVTGFDYMTYGFTMDAAGNIRLNYPQSVDGEKHRGALITEFSGWTFN